MEDNMNGGSLTTSNNVVVRHFEEEEEEKPLKITPTAVPEDPQDIV